MQLSVARWAISRGSSKAAANVWPWRQEDHEPARTQTLATNLYRFWPDLLQRSHFQRFQTRKRFKRATANSFVWPKNVESKFRQKDVQQLHRRNVRQQLHLESVWKPWGHRFHEAAFRYFSAKPKIPKNSSEQSYIHQARKRRRQFIHKFRKNRRRFRPRQICSL